MQTWEVWFPDAAATGLLVARCRIEPADVIWVHAAPARIAVVVRDGLDRPIAHAAALERHGGDSPMCRLALEDGELTREDRFPTEADTGAVVVLPGGEAGILQQWWNAPDGNAWRWSVEFQNHR